MPYVKIRYFTVTAIHGKISIKNFESRKKVESAREMPNEAEGCPFPCLHQGKCVEFMGRWMCNCKTGYTGDQCQLR